MPFVVIQEFPIEGGDRSTPNYDRVQEALGTRENPPAGGLVHTAGFDEEAGVFRIFDVWESEDAWNTFMHERLLPVVQPMLDGGATPPVTRAYELHDFMAAPAPVGAS
jgi:hypothetical protein